MPASLARRMRRQSRLLELACGTPWAILPSKLAAIQTVLEERLAGIRLTNEEIAARIGPLALAGVHRSSKGMRDSAPSGIAVLNISGTIAPRMDKLSASSGGVSAEEIGMAVEQAAADPQVGTIILNFDTPGGQVALIPETGAKIRAAAAVKPVIAVANPMICSAGYWLASQATEIVATPSADVGSIGVLAMHVDQSGADKKAGLVRTILTTSPQKWEMNPYSPLTEAAKARLEGEIQAMHKEFVGAIAAGRGITAEESQTWATGRVYTAAEALAMGMIDRVATLDQVLAELMSRSSAQGAGNNPLLKGVSAMPPEVRAALLARGLIAATATEEHAQVALVTYFATIGRAVPAEATEIVAAIQATITPPNPPMTVTVPAPGQGGASGTPVQTTQTAAPLSHFATQLQPQTPMCSAATLNALLKISRLPAEQRLEINDALIGAATAGTLTLDAANARIDQALTNHRQPAGTTTVSFGQNQIDTIKAEAVSALIPTLMQSMPQRIFNPAKKAWENYSLPKSAAQFNSLQRCVRGMLMAQGVPYGVVSELTNADVAFLILEADPQSNYALRPYLGADGAAFNVRGMFTNVFYDASNISLRTSYMEVPTTFNLWAKRDKDFEDFKLVHKIQLGEIGDPKVITENGPFEEMSTVDGRESYQATLWGDVISLTFQMMQDDRLDAFAEMQQKMARGFPRKWEKMVYQKIKDNPTLATDGVAVFHSSHSNTTSGVGSVTIANLNTVELKMLAQKGLSTDASVLINVTPKYCLVPPTRYRTEAKLILQQAGTDPASSNASVPNVYQNELTPIMVRELSAAQGGADTTWYLVADQMECPAMYYAYMKGMESPKFDQAASFDRLAIRQRAYQAFACMIPDFRPWQRATA